MTNPPTLRQLRHLVELARHRHFGRAAQTCHVTQSTLSASIKELEDLLQATLVDRTRRRVVVTPLGQTIVERAEDILRRVDDLVEAARVSREPLSGPLRLGVIPTIGPFLLPRCLPALRRRYPKLRLYLTEDLTDRLLEQPVGQVLRQIEPELRIAPPQGRQAARQQEGADRRDDAETQRAGERLPAHPRRLHQVVHAAQDVLRPLDDRLAEGRHDDPAAGAVDQRRLQQVLQLLDAGAERRLGDVAGLRRPAEMAVARQLHEMPQLPQGRRISHR